MSEAITQLSIQRLLSSNAEYVIPMYQRNYAWEEGEITQLIQDVIDYLPKQDKRALPANDGRAAEEPRQQTRNRVNPAGCT